MEQSKKVNDYRENKDLERDPSILNDCKSSVNTDIFGGGRYCFHDASLHRRKLPFPAWPLYLTKYHLSGYFPYLGAIFTGLGKNHSHDCGILGNSSPRLRRQKHDSEIRSFLRKGWSTAEGNQM